MCSAILSGRKTRASILTRRRHANLDALNELLEGVMIEQPRAYWRERLDAAGIPNAPEHDTGEMLAQPQTERSEIVQKLAGSSLALMGLPVRFDGERAPLTRLAPSLGEHNDDLIPP